MAQQTRMATVLPYYRRWIRRFPNWSCLAQAPRRVVLSHWEGLGYYRRARFLHELARSVIRRPDRRLPSDPETLRSLPGIGDYTAGAIASIAFGIAEPAFDGNVERVLGRLTARRSHALGTKTLRKLAGRLVPEEDPGTHNQSFMELGALVCLPKKPLCTQCPFHKVCPSVGKKISTARSQSKISKIKESIHVIRKGSSVWLTRQHPQGRWRGLWLLPTSVPSRQNTKPIHRISYPYTRYQISARVFTLSQPPTDYPGRWFALGSLDRIPLPTPHRRIVNTLIMNSNTRRWPESPRPSHKESPPPPLPRHECRRAVAPHAPRKPGQSPLR